VLEHPPTPSTPQLLPSPYSAEVTILADTQVEENDTHPDAIEHEQQDGPSYLRETKPVATKDLSPSLLSSTASANNPTPVIAEEEPTILPTNDTAADYYSPDPLYEDSYYLPDPLYEDSYYLPDPLYEDSYYLPDPLYEDSYYLPDPLYEDSYYLPDPLYEEEVDHE
jgi:hypothetical protein